MEEMRRLLQIVESAEGTSEGKTKLDEGILGMAEVPTFGSRAIEEDRSREEYETHITKDSYAPHNAMGDVQMEDTDLDEECDDDDIDESIQIVHEDDVEVDEVEVDEADDSGPDAWKAKRDAAIKAKSGEDTVTEGEVDPEILDWLKRLEG